MFFVVSKHSIILRDSISDLMNPSLADSYSLPSPQKADKTAVTSFIGLSTTRSIMSGGSPQELLFIIVTRC